MPSITNTFFNASSILASAHNRNYSDCLEHLTDGSEDLTISDILVNGNLSIANNSVLGGSSSKTISVNSLVNASMLANSGKDLGSTTNPFKSLFLNNALYFDAGTTKYIGASGTSLLFSGISEQYFNGAGFANTTINAATMTASNLSLGGKINGERYILTGITNFTGGTVNGTTYDLIRSSSSTPYFGIIMPSSGSIIGYSYYMYTDVTGATTVSVKILKNASTFLTIGSISTSSDGFVSNVGTQARGTSTFAADDYLTFAITPASGSLNSIGGVLNIEVAIDA